MEQGSRPIQILLAEDNPADAYLVREALKEHDLNFDLHVVQHGEDAIAFLRREGEWSSAPVPDLILLDLNLPRSDGAEVLQSARQLPELRHVPVAILTSSDSPRDRRDLARLGADQYFRKPAALDEFMAIGGEIRALWNSRSGREMRAGAAGR